MVRRTQLYLDKLQKNMLMTSSQITNMQFFDDIPLWKQVSLEQYIKNKNNLAPKNI